MKNSSLILNIVLLIAVAVIYVLHFTDEKSPVAEEAVVVDSISATSLPIAYVKVDSLILNYDLAQDLHDEFSKKQEAYTKEYGDKRKKFEEQAAAFQEKVQRGGFLTQERAMQERDRLVNEEQKITELDQQLSGKLGQMQSANNQQLLDSLLNYLKIYNADKKYSYIINASEILIGDETNNITAEVLTQLNARYSKAKSK